MSEKKSCFVVTPIGDENTAIRRHIDGIIDQAIIPAIGDEFEIKVAHREYEIGSINARVIRNVYNADLVIANLTGLNPNVMFELGVRYSCGKATIVIAEIDTKLPFDITDENTIFYINDPSGAAELRDKLEEFVKRIDLESNKYGPVVSAVKSAVLLEKIETGISDEDSRNAFSYMAEKVENLEAAVKEMQIKNNDTHKHQYVDQDLYSDIKKIRDLSQAQAQMQKLKLWGSYLSDSNEQ